MLEDIADAIMDLSGGSSVPLWNSYFDGMQQAAINSDEMNLQELKILLLTDIKSLPIFRQLKSVIKL